MSLLKLIPSIYYNDVEEALTFFTEALAFTIRYRDHNLCIIDRDNTTLHLVTVTDPIDPEDRPELRIETDSIYALYAEVKARAPKWLHPNLKVVKHQPRGLKEFALLDKTHVCLIVQERL